MRPFTKRKRERFPLETIRLKGRRVAASDLRYLRQLHADPRVMALLSADGRTLTEKESAAILDNFLAAATPGLGAWLFFDATYGDFVGYCGLRRTMIDGRDEIELFFAVAAHAWGRNFAPEMAAAVLDRAREHLGALDVVAVTLPDNARSRRVMEKCGFTYERDVIHAGLPHVLYRLRM